MRHVILEEWNSHDLLSDVNIMTYISSFSGALSQWKRKNDVTSEKQVEELKEKV